MRKNKKADIRQEVKDGISYVCVLDKYGKAELLNIADYAA